MNLIIGFGMNEYGTIVFKVLITFFIYFENQIVQTFLLWLGKFELFVKRLGFGFWLFEVFNDKIHLDH